MCQSKLLRAIIRWPDLELQSAQFVIDFDLSTLDEKGVWATATVGLYDEQGKLWVGKDLSYIIVDWREQNKADSRINITTNEWS